MAWSPELMEKWGEAMGAEQRAKGTNVMLGPDVNLARVPWSGRVFETMGEDPKTGSPILRQETAQYLGDLVCAPPQNLPSHR